MNSNIPSSDKAGAPQNTTSVEGLDGDTVALKIALKTGSKAANRKADDTTIDMYAGLNKLLSRGTVALLEVKIKEGQIAAAMAKMFTKGVLNPKAAGAQLRMQFHAWCQTAGVHADQTSFAVFTQDIRSRLGDAGAASKDLDAAFAEAQNGLDAFPLASTGVHSRGNV